MRRLSLRKFISSGVRRVLKGKPVVKPPAGDSYYGERACGYTEARVNQAHWPIEQKSVKRFLNQLPDNLSVLDVPCGTGRFFSLFTEKNGSIVGLDRSIDMIRAARSEVPEDSQPCGYIISDCRQLPFPNEAFDLVLCFRFLGSVVPLDHARLMLAELLRVTRTWVILELKYRHSDSKSGVGTTMKHLLDKPALEELLKEQSLKIVEEEVVFERPSHSCLSVLCRKI